MGSSTSELPSNSKTSVCSFEDLFCCSFLNLNLGDDGVRCKHVNTSQGNNVNGTGSSSNTYADQTQRDKVSDIRSIRSSDNWSSNSGDRQQFFALPSIAQDNIWAYHNPSYAGHGHGGRNQNSAVNIVGASVLGKGGYNMVYGKQGFYDPLSENLFASSSTHQFGATRSNNGGYLGTNGYYYSNDSRNQYIGEARPDELFWPPGCSIITLAKDKHVSQYLQTVLLQCESYADIILEGVLDSIFELMTDQHGHHLFDRLVETYRGRYHKLQLIVDNITSQPYSLIVAALNHNGSHSIQKLIKQLKKSHLALKMTRSLSTGFYELMTHKIGRHVIVQCFILLDYMTNEILYEEAIRNCMALATNPNGCISLNDCINCITGHQRQRLLGVILNNSLTLSHDPSGNFVVQHVLGLHNQDYILHICTRLRGNYTDLSMEQNGSHIVEKCIRLSREGMRYAVQELSKSKKLVEIARNQFGNYVIQTALKATMFLVDADEVLYESLASALVPHLSSLENHKHGRNHYKIFGF